MEGGTTNEQQAGVEGWVVMRWACVVATATEHPTSRTKITCFDVS